MFGSDTIPIGGTAVSQCRTINSFLLLWNVNNQEEHLFDSIAPTGTVIGVVSEAHLVEVSRNDNTNNGNRTSYLTYKSDPTFTGNVTISCNDGRILSSCVHSLIIGM